MRTSGPTASESLGAVRALASREATRLRGQSRQQLTMAGVPEYEWTSDDWATPPSLMERLRAEFGAFDLDPCAVPETAKADRFYTPAEDGLQRPWRGLVFCNPPYSGVTAWLRKARLSAREGATVVCLIPAHTDRGWWHDLVEGQAEVRFLRGRVKFLGRGGKAGNPTFGSALVIYRSAHNNEGTKPNE